MTAGIAGGSIYAGIFGESYAIGDRHTRWGVVITLGGAALIILGIDNPLKGLIYSQIALSMQLPFTTFLQLYLTSSRKVMGEYANPPFTRFILALVAGIVVVLNVMLLHEMLAGKPDTPRMG